MFQDSNEQLSEFDPHFKIFHDLMPFKVQEILLISSRYDAFIMEEDGSLATRLINEYHGLNLSKPPKITRTSSAIKNSIWLLPCLIWEAWMHLGLVWR